MYMYKVSCLLYFLVIFIHNPGCGQSVEYGKFQHEYIDTINKAEMEIVTVQESETAVLPCYFNLTDSKVIWIGPNSTILAVDDQLSQRQKRMRVKKLSPKHWNLHIMGVNLDDQGIYECRMKSQPGVVKQVILIVQVPASIQFTFTHYQSVYAGTDVELQCPTDGIPPPTITWYRLLGDDEDTREKLETGGEEIDTYYGEESYIISNMTMSKAGYYECHASNGVGPGVWQKFFVECKQLPTFFEPDEENVTVSKGEVAVLPCAVHNINEYQVAWYKSRSQISYRTSISYYNDRFSLDRPTSDDWSLQIKQVSSWDAGKYTCRLIKNFTALKVKIVNLIVIE